MSCWKDAPPSPTSETCTGPECSERPHTENSSRMQQCCHARCTQVRCGWGKSEGPAGLKGRLRPSHLLVTPWSHLLHGCCYTDTMRVWVCAGMWWSNTSAVGQCVTRVNRTLQKVHSQTGCLHVCQGTVSKNLFVALIPILNKQSTVGLKRSHWALV